MMNKIEVMDNRQINKQLKDDIVINDYQKLKSLNEDILFIYIPSNLNTSVELKINSVDYYQQIYIMVDHDSDVNILECKQLNIPCNIEYHYVIKDNSNLIINKFYCVNTIEEKTNIDLIGINSKITYNLSTMTNQNQNYIMNINHKHQNTISNINHHGLTFDTAKLTFDINGIVPKGMINSTLNQDNRIILMGDNYSSIKPNLFIDEYQVNAKHAATIGKFNEEELFYLQTRGLSLKDSYELLMKGFLLGILMVDDQTKESFANIITNYRR